MAKYSVKPGSTDVTVYVQIVDSTTAVGETGLVYNTSGLAAYYVRTGGTATAITLATQTVGGAHSDGGFVEVSSANMPGLYRLDLPDAAVASGARAVEIMVKGTGILEAVVTLDLNAEVNATHLGGTAQTGRDVGASVLLSSGTGTGQVSLSSGRVNADTVYWNGAAVATPDTSGHPKVTIKSGSGTGEVSLSSGGVTLSTSGLAATADAVWDEAASGHVAAGSFGARLMVIRSATAQAGSSTTITLDASASASDDFYNNTIIQIAAGTGAGQGRFISDYNGTTKVATVSSWVTNPSSDSVFVITPFGSIPGATAPTASEVADAVWDEARADHVAAGSFGQAGQIIRSATAQAGTTSSITLDASASATNDLYNYQVVTVLSGTGAGQSRQITDYVGSTKVATVDPAFITAPSSDSVFAITPLGIDAATLAQIADAVWDEARSGHATAGTFGEYVFADTVRLSGDATAADNAEAFFDGTGYAGTGNTIPTVTNVGTVTGNVNGSVGSVTGAVGSVTGAVGSVTGNVGGNVVGSVASVTGNVGGNVVGSVASVTAGVTLTNAGIDALFTRQLTESYAADGAAPTVAQALLLIQQTLGDFSISGTTLTVKKLDGSTTAATFTLNDGSAPTALTRSG